MKLGNLSAGEESGIPSVAVKCVDVYKRQVQYYAKPEIVANVPPNCFIPRPNVGSAVIRLDRYAEPPVQTADEQFMFSVIRASFNQRRKTLVNGLSNAPGLNVSKEKIKEVLARMELSETVRGETLTLEQFAQLADLLRG